MDCASRGRAGPRKVIFAHAASGRIVLVEDITEKRIAEQKIDWLARYDALTEIANRYRFREQLENWFSALQPGTGFALHWIDLDHFKEVNDTFGHPTGDVLLQSVATRLRGILRGPDVVARFGGDEFAIIRRGLGRKFALLPFKVADFLLQLVGPDAVIEHQGRHSSLGALACPLEP